jgi:hypothetical protein
MVTTGRRSRPHDHPCHREIMNAAGAMLYYPVDRHEYVTMAHKHRHLRHLSNVFSLMSLTPLAPRLWRSLAPPRRGTYRACVVLPSRHGASLGATLAMGASQPSRFAHF